MATCLKATRSTELRAGWTMRWLTESYAVPSSASHGTPALTCGACSSSVPKRRGSTC